MKLESETQLLDSAGVIPARLRLALTPLAGSDADKIPCSGATS